jgi:hypothetical protein
MEPFRLLAGTARGLFRITTDGATADLEGEIRGLCQGTDSLWCLRNRREIWRERPDGGWTWVASLEDGIGLCLLPVAPGLWAGTSQTSLFHLLDGSMRPVTSLGHAPGRRDWWSPGDAPEVRSMSSDDQGNRYLNIHVGGILKTGDQGKTWAPTIDINTDVHQVLFDRASRLLLGASARGLAVSRDRGESWQLLTEGLHATYLRAVAVSRDCIFVSASTGPRTRKGGIYRTPLHDPGVFEKAAPREGFLPGNVNTFCLAALESRVAFGTEEGDVLLSEDEGRSWRRVASELGTVRCLLLPPAGRATPHVLSSGMAAG